MDAWLSTGCDGSYYNAAMAERLSAKKSCGPQAPSTSPAHSTTTEIGRWQHDWVNTRKMGTTEIFLLNA